AAPANGGAVLGGAGILHLGIFGLAIGAAHDLVHLWSYEFDCGKIGPITSAVPRHDRQIEDSRVGPDEEIGQDSSPDASGPSIERMDLGRHKKGGARYRQHLQTGIRDESIERLHGFKPRRQFGVDDVIDDQGTRRLSTGESLYRPILPNRIPGQQIQQHVRIYECQSSPRVRAMISSVVRPGPSMPRYLSNRLATFFPSTRCTTTSLRSFSRNSTSPPGSRRNISRTVFGMVTCPFVVTLVLM